MTVNAIGAVSPSQQTGSAASTAATPTLDYNSFLKLLLAEMKNQDPMEPMKGSEYVAQLATFSQVEKSVQMNDRLAALLTSSQLNEANGLIGRSVTSPDGSVSGVATAARISSDGVTAIFADGSELLISQGVKIS
jgi:flagellar basal-body rod modification protein FlgD